MKKKITTSQLTVEQRREITELASRVAIEQYHKEAERTRKAMRDRRLHNTKLLMEKYRGFVEHSKSAVFEATQVENDIDFETLMSDLMGGDMTGKMPSVRSIQESAAYTRIIVHHIDHMIEYFKFRCERSPKPEDMRRYRTIYYLYIAEDEKNAQQISEMENVDITTVYRDLKTALRQLSALIFGYFE